MSPASRIKNEIDFLLCNKKYIICIKTDISVINKCFIRSDHRLLRAKIQLGLEESEIKKKKKLVE